MPSVLGQVGQNVADNLFELGKGVVAGTAKAATDIVSETIEQVTGAPGQATAQNAPKNESSEVTGGDEKKRMAEKQRFEEVKGELARYMERKKQLDQRIAEDKEAEKNEQDKKVFEKRKKENFTQALLKKLGAGSHGETERQKE